MSPNTENIEARLCAYIDGELDDAARAELERHLDANPEHRLLIADLMGQRDLIRALPIEGAPAELREAIQQQMERSMLLGDAGAARMKIRRWPQVVALAAIVVLTVGLGVVVYQVVTPPEPHMAVTMAVPTTAPVPLVTENAEKPSDLAFGVASSAREKVEPERLGGIARGDGPASGPHIRLATPGELLEAREKAETVAESPVVAASPPVAVAGKEVLQEKASEVVDPAVHSVGAMGGGGEGAGANDGLTLSPPVASLPAGAGGMKMLDDVLDRAGFTNRATNAPLIVVLNSSDISSAEQHVTRVLNDNSLAWESGENASDKSKSQVAPPNGWNGRKQSDADAEQSILLKSNVQQNGYPRNQLGADAMLKDQIQSNFKSREVVDEMSKATADARRGRQVYVVRGVPAKRARDVAGQINLLNRPVASESDAKDAMENIEGTKSPLVPEKKIEAHLAVAPANPDRAFAPAPAEPPDSAMKTDVPSTLPTTTPVVEAANVAPATVPGDAEAVDLVIVVQATPVEEKPVAIPLSATAPVESPSTQPVLP